MTPGFKPLHRSFLTLGHSVAYCVLASMELARLGWSPSRRTTPLRDYALVALFCFLSVSGQETGASIDVSSKVE